ncbi:ubiquitin-like protein 4A isoform X4 [Syngnathoides biaculeatus]|uniref:ubiquitin-like protein 4A isoform X4 n=1 Tax=Syngnathoides biaculeatus TaxID=300417 RepID=UPI002ADE3745|nr:ubiquitin-like protein 4A isoform X4 [Syngnathoides biaculeatus]
MILTVKPLQGKECSVHVTEDEKVSTVKELVSERLNIPANQQRLLYKGKALAVGERTGASAVATGSGNCSATQGGVWQTVSVILAKHFSPADAAKVHEQLIKDYERSLRQLSLDDIERLAGRLLHPEVEGMDTSSYMD